MPGWIYFNLHDLIRIRLDARHSAAESVVTEFEHFRTGVLDSWNLSLLSRPILADKCARTPTDETLDEGTLFLPRWGLSVSAQDDQIVLGGHRDLLPYVQPFIQWLLVRQGHVLVHAAAIAVNGCGILLPAPGGTGKTSAVARLLKERGSAFLADDWTVVSAEGELLSLPKPFFVYPYHRSVFPHLFINAPKFLVPKFLSSLTQRVRETTKPVFMRFPRLEQIARKYTPEHMRVPARTALPFAMFAQRAPLSAVVFLDLWNGGKVVVEPVPLKLARRRLIGSALLEMSDRSQKLLLICGSAGLLPVEEILAGMQDVVERALQSRQLFRVKLPKLLPGAVGEAVFKAVQSIVE